jgi:two-component sensor histidine kinase
MANSGGSIGVDLAGFIRRLAQVQTSGEVLSVVTAATRSLLKADGATFVLRDGDRCHYAEEDAISPLWKGRRFPLGACISGWCMSHDEAVAIPDIRQDSRIPMDAYRPTFVRSLAMAPVRLGGPVAAIGAYWADRRQVSGAELETLKTIADAAALALTSRFSEAEAAGQKTADALLPAADPASAAGAQLRRMIRAGLAPTSPAAFGFATVCVAIATLVRWLIWTVAGAGFAPFSTYYPAALIAVLVAGPWAGAFAVILGGALGYWAFLPPDRAALELDVQHILSALLYLLCNGLIIFTVQYYRWQVRQLSDEGAWRLDITRELRHRAKNSFAVIQSIVANSLSAQPDVAQSIIRRIGAALAHDAGPVAERGHSAAPKDVRQILEAELEPFSLDRFKLEGAETLLGAKAAAGLALALHELATNATKHGALGSPDGRVEVDWSVARRTVSIHWMEIGGPPVQPPEHRGFGSVFLRRVLTAAGGSIVLEFPPTGAQAHLSVPRDDRRQTWAL